MKKLRCQALIISFIAIWILLPATVSAATMPSVSRSYSFTEPIEPGSIVSLTSLESKTVTLASTTNSARIIGVAVAANGSIISVNPDDAKVQVTTSGLADVLVSNLNGDIKAGDKVAVSPFAGLGMKSGSGERIIGLARTDFTSASKALTTKDVTDKDGKSKSIRIAKVQIQVVIGDDDLASAHLNGLQRVVKSMTGRTVPTIRIVISLVIAIVTLITLIIMIYSAIYGSIMSIGRNPLAKGSILRALRQVTGIAAITLFAAMVFIFLLLR